MPSTPRVLRNKFGIRTPGRYRRVSSADEFSHDHRFWTLRTLAIRVPTRVDRLFVDREKATKSLIAENSGVVESAITIQSGDGGHFITGQDKGRNVKILT